MADLDPQTGRPAPPEGEIKDYMDRNPGATRDSAITAWNLYQDPKVAAQARDNAAASTQGTGWGDPNRSMLENVLDKARGAVKYVDTLGGLVPPSAQAAGHGFIDPDTLVPHTAGEAVGNTVAGAAGGAGIGLVPSLLRIAGAAGGAYGGENMFGTGDPGTEALKQVAGQTLAEAGGSLQAKIAAHRFAKWAALHDSTVIPATIGAEIEPFSYVKTPNDVQALPVTGQRKLSFWYGAQSRNLVEQSGDPMVNAPALAELKDMLLPPKVGPTQTGPPSGPVSSRPDVAGMLGIPTAPGLTGAPAFGTGLPGGSQMPLSAALRFIQTAGDVVHAGPRTPQSVQMQELWRQAQEEILQGLPPHLQAEYQHMKAQYGAGKALIEAIEHGGKDVFVSDGRGVKFNSTPDPVSGKTPLQRAIYDSPYLGGDTANPINVAAVRGGEPGTGDFVHKNFLQNLWARAKGLEGLGLSAHTGIPGTPSYAGARQPIIVPPAVNTAGGQALVNTLRSLSDSGGINLGPNPGPESQPR